jgi:hypothetical protein
VAGRGVRAGDTNPGTTSPASQYEDLPLDFLAGLGFFLVHILPLFDRGLKLGLERKEPA